MAQQLSSRGALKCVALIGAVAVLSALAQDVTANSPLGPVIAGDAIVIDGDTLEIGGRRIRLEGIDAPEMAQSCQTDSGSPWRCGRAAQQKLTEVTRGQTVACDAAGTDKYGRILAVCFVEGEDINAALVRQGLAWAFVRYSELYVSKEAEARAARRGIWQADNTAPWDFRHGRWQTAEASAPLGCAIKGNVSSKGMIYHAPWSAWYDKVKIDEARGERWFCSEDEAIAAGWRAAQQR